MDVTSVNADSADALFGELKSVASRKAPIILFNWASTRTWLMIVGRPLVDT